jgi:hypothetical protein
VVTGVPARVCGNCGEEYVDETIAERLIDTAADAVRTGVNVDVRDYAGVVPGLKLLAGPAPARSSASERRWR